MTYQPAPAGQIVDLHLMYDRLFGTRHGFFVDVGAFDGVQWSNTYPLAQAGWSGLLVEPQPYFAAACRTQVAKPYPQVRVVEAAVSNYIGPAELVLNGSVSTINPDAIAGYADLEGLAFTVPAQSTAERITVPAVTLDFLLTTQDVLPYFEVLSIDAEGSELDILESFTIAKWQPALVLIEVHEMCAKPLWTRSVPVNWFFAEAGYMKVYCDHINNVYLRGDLA